MNNEVEELLDIIYDLNPRQRNSIQLTMDRYFTEDDYTQLAEVVRFYQIESDIQTIAEAYNLIVVDTANETRYFLKNGTYRYSSFEETEKLVYSNKEYMSKYMIGLAISGYLWPNHIRIFHWYQEMLQKLSGDHYLEVGPGHGRYLCEAVRRSGFKDYDAIDVSETSVEQTRSFINAHLEDEFQRKCNVFKQNAYNYRPSKKYDFIVIAEVLEHLEDPARMLGILSKISSDAAYLYVTVPVNAPAIDHIYLFNSTEEVERMIIDAGYDIIDKLYAPGGDMELDKAIKRKNSILVGILARKVLK